MDTPSQYENLIRRLLVNQKIDSALLALRDLSSDLDPFVAAGTALFIVRFCRPLNSNDRAAPQMDRRVMAKIAHWVKGYLVCDPLGYDEGVLEKHKQSNPIFALFRIFSNQAAFAISPIGPAARSMILFGQCPQLVAGMKGVPKFDFAEEFLRSNGSTLEDFVRICYVATSASASKNHLGFDLGYFKKARKDGMPLPTEKVITRILSSISADPAKFKSLYLRHRRQDRTFEVYDYNPIFQRPLIRPWQTGPLWNRMLAPLSGLVANRCCAGIYYQMRHDCPNFTSYFGYLFESYVGIILNACKDAKTKVLSERDVRRAYPVSYGKCPDWAVIQGDTAILFECKATNFRPDARVTGEEEAINQSLLQVKKGLKQLHQFIEACKAKHPRLTEFHGCTKFHPIIVTFEILHLINSGWFREHINGLVKDDIEDVLPWHIMDVEQLERFQPHALAGQTFDRLFSSMNSALFYDVLKVIEEDTGLQYKDSFMWEREIEIMKGLGATNGIISQLEAIGEEVDS